MIPAWIDIEGLAKWVIRGMHRDDDYREYLGFAYLVYERCKTTYNPEKGNFPSYYRLRLWGELHKEHNRDNQLVHNVPYKDLLSLNDIAVESDTYEYEYIDGIEDTRFIPNYDDLAQEIIEMLDKSKGLDPIKLASIKNRIQNEYRIVPKNDATYDAALEMISMYLKD